MAKKLRAITEIAADRDAPTTAANAKHADLLTRHERERIASERATAGAIEAAERSYADELAANEAAVAAAGAATFAPLIAAFLADPASGASKIVAAARALDAEALRATGRGLPGLHGFPIGNPIALAVMRSELAKDPAAITAFGDPAAWHNDITGLVAVVDRVMRLVHDSDALPHEMTEALLQLVSSIRRMGRAGRNGPIGRDEAEHYWAVMQSGASPAALEEMFFELRSRKESRLKATAAEEIDLQARARGGEIIPGRSPAWHRIARGALRLVGASMSAGAPVGGRASTTSGSRAASAAAGDEL
jgi:hypothetical protein